MKNALKLFVAYSLVLIVLTAMLPYSAYASQSVTPYYVEQELNLWDLCSAEYLEQSNQLVFILDAEFDEVAWKYCETSVKLKTLESFYNISSSVQSMLDSCDVPGTISVCFFKTNDDAIIGLCVNGNVLTDYI